MRFRFASPLSSRGSRFAGPWHGYRGSVHAWVMGVALLASAPGRAQTIVVSPEGPVRTIQEGLRIAGAGAEVRVRKGIYREGDLKIDRRLTLSGEEGAVIEGDGTQQLLTVAADSVVVRGLTFRHIETSFVEDRAAIKVEEAKDCLIADNRLEDTFFGIYLAKSSGCRVENNTLLGAKESESRSGNGIHLWYCRDIEIRRNRVSGHRDGIYLEFVEDSRIEDNTSFRNHRYGLHFMFSDRSIYRNNTFRENDAGVAVMYTKNVQMEDNHFENNWGPASYGLLLKDITDSRVSGNTFRRNTVAIYLEGSNRIAVEGNRFSESGWAVKIMANAEDNRFEGNSFEGNSFDVATNSRMSASRFTGNYWDHYRGYDLDRDGIGDVPFRPVRLFSLLVERNAPALVLLRSFLIDLLDTAERVFPVLTPETLVDEHPLMKAGS